MKIIGLTIQHFLTVGDAVTLALDGRGLVLIQGKNDDDPSASSNGSGKSSIPDALCWALYGTTARGEAGDAIVNEKRKKDCLVQVVLQDGDSVYRVLRHRKHAAQKNALLLHLWNPASDYPGGVPTDLTKGTEKETQAAIEQVMGCSYEVFCAAVYAGQEAMPDLPGMTDKQLKLLIEQASGVERLERAYAIARAEEQTVAGRLATAQVELQRNESALTSAKGTLLDQQTKFNAFEAERPAKRQKWLDEMSSRAVAMKATHAELQKVNESALKQELGELQTQLGQHASLSGAWSAAQAAVGVEERAVFLAEQKLALCKQNLANYQHHLAHVADATPCPECGKPRTPEEIEQARQRLSTEQEAEGRKAVEAQTALKLARQKLEEAQAAAEAAKRAIPDVTVAAARSNEIHGLLRQAEGWKNVIRNDHLKYQQAQQASDAVLTETNPYKAALDLAGRRIEELEVAARDIRAAIVVEQHALDLKQAVTRVFSPAGVRAHILDTVTPFLNERTAEYLSALSDGNISAVWSTLTATAKGELREKFNIECENDKGAKSFKGLSGGEKRKVRLATMLALQDLVAARATKPIDIWIGDEIDHALDEAGLERLMTILERKAREHGTVLIISHNSLSEWCDQQVTVTKRGGVSTVEGVLCV